jgi:hypothetical protein
MLTSIAFYYRIIKVNKIITSSFIINHVYYYSIITRIYAYSSLSLHVKQELIDINKAIAVITI